MNLGTSIFEGVLINRYKRFLSDIKLDSGETITAHVANPGSMEGVKDPGSRVRLTKSSDAKRKLPFSLEMVRTTKGTWVGVNTSRTNKIVEEAFFNKVIPHWSRFENLKAEVKINAKTRLDFCLSDNQDRLHYVEVKNVSMAKPPLAIFPDSVTVRGQKHLQELMELQKQGHSTEILFVVQREDCDSFSPADDIDPEYGRLLRMAASQGVKISCWTCRIHLDSITLDAPIKIQL
ncbi:MAG: DNA/RNA nuclease SfsA [Oligoflexia bacterium]|nr:DNA/RNA nuclease SfsA [Oligoflexia bacterium]